MRSPYTLDNPPPLTPPRWVILPAAVGDWLVAAKLWRIHTPEPLDHRSRRCRTCGTDWECEWWVLADRVLARIFAVFTPGCADSAR